MSDLTCVGHATGAMADEAEFCLDHYPDWLNAENFLALVDRIVSRIDKGQLIHETWAEQRVKLLAELRSVDVEPPWFYERGSYVPYYEAAKRHMWEAEYGPPKHHPYPMAVSESEYLDELVERLRSPRRRIDGEE